jgi:Tfp pilus assembly protein PilO
MNTLRGFNLVLLKSKVVLIVTGAVILLLIVWWLVWMTPESNKLTKAEKKLVLRELPYLKKVSSAIPPTEDPPGIVDSLNNLATATNCDLLSVTPEDSPSPSGISGLSDISVTFQVSGSHSDVFRFLKGFYSMGRLMTINTVSLAAAGSNSNILAVNDGQQYSMSVSAMAYTTYVTATPST